MLAGAVGVPAKRADELLEQTRMAGVADHRLRTFSPGMNRRIELAAALLGDPRILLLDTPTEDLSPRNAGWFRSFLRCFAVAGGTVLVTARTPQEAAALGDRVITLDRGRLVADQPVANFRRTRLQPEVSVRGPQMARLADLLLALGAEVRREGGVGIAVSGVGRTEIGELAYRHGILLHELADRVVEQPIPHPVLPVASGRSGHVHLQPTEPVQDLEAGTTAVIGHAAPADAFTDTLTDVQGSAPSTPAVLTALRPVTEPLFREEQLGHQLSEAPFHDGPFNDGPLHDGAFHEAPFHDAPFRSEQLREEPVLHLDQPAQRPAAGPDHRSE